MVYLYYTIEVNKKSPCVSRTFSLKDLLPTGFRGVFRRLLGWKRVRGGGIKVIPNEEAILAAQKDFGIFVILSNLHASPWDVLRRYRRRNDI